MALIAAIKLSANNIEFWPDDVSLSDAKIFDHGKIYGAGQLTDIYLLGLAVNKGCGLVTVDQNIPVAAVREASKLNLLVL